MFVLRNASLADIDAIMRIEKESFHPLIQEAQQVFEQRLQIFPQGFLLFLHDTTGEIAGYICSERWKAVPECAKNFSVGHDAARVHHVDGAVLYLSSFALLKKYRGRGNGSLLFKRTLREFVNRLAIKCVLLMVHAEWAGARHIYEAAGFKIYMTIPNAFPQEAGKAADGIVMQYRPADDGRTI